VWRGLSCKQTLGMGDRANCPYTDHAEHKLPEAAVRWISLVPVRLPIAYDFRLPTTPTVCLHERELVMSNTDEYFYQLPPELIAQYPLRQRADARMLVVDRSREGWEHLHVRDLPSVLAAGDCLVLNRTRVIPARLVGARADTGGRWEGLYLGSDEQGTWRVVFRTRGKVRSGCRIVLRDADGRDRAILTILAELGQGEWAARPDGHAVDPLRLLEEVGHVPLPHYIRDGQMVDTDRGAYQTVYGDRPGSVAAPTAGLHFTKSLLQECSQSGIDFATVTLHVGIGTFRPVNSETLEEHVMHAEEGEISARCVEQIQQTRARGGRVVAVGTTSVRVLETVAGQPSGLQTWSGQTRLFIRPPYEFRAIDALLTNFHLPCSTLLVLVRTFGGDELIKAAYEDAIRNKYRFFSYGDAMLIL